MRWYGKELYCNRGETFALDFTIVNSDDTPYRLSNILDNMFLLLTVTSGKNSQKDRYIFRNWINLSNFPKVDDMTILNVTKLPEGTDLIRHRILRFNNKYYIYDEKELKYIEYNFRLIHTFDSKITKEWAYKTYEYDLKLVSGTLNKEYEKSLETGEAYTGVPLDEILFESVIISKNNIYVEENSSAGANYYG